MMGWRHGVILGALAVIGLALGWAFLDALGAHQGARLAELAAARVPESGVSNQVTAVLLNFRAYDTLLELAVLLAAILGIWSSGPAPGGYRPAGEVMEGLVAWVVPLLILTGGYLLWVGAHAPGGAFQAGALLGAAGVTLRLAGHAGAGLPREPALRVVLGLGVLVFTLTGLALGLLAEGFLTYPPGLAKWLILGIETAATLAIGATLTAAYLGGHPQDPGRGRLDQGGLRP